jgi:hypothetical protein
VHDISEQMLLVAGMPRSGTTMLAEHLVREGIAKIGPETHFYRRWYRRVAAALRNGSEAQMSGEFLEELERLGYEPRRQPAGGARTPTLFLRAHLEACGDEGQLVGEKTPMHAEWILTALRESPGTRSLTIVRDPRELVRSLGAVNWNDRTIGQRAARWHTTSVLTRLASHRFPDRALAVRFEDFVGDPTTTLARIRNSFDLDRTATSYRSGRPGTFQVEEEPWKSRAAGVADPSRCYARQRAPSADDDVVASAARRELTAWGYSTGAPVPVAARVLLSVDALLEVGHLVRRNLPQLRAWLRAAR